MAEKEASGKKAPLARTVKDKWRSKKWYKVRAPGLFQHADLGETVATEPEQLIGRTLETTLPEISGHAGRRERPTSSSGSRSSGSAGDGVAETRFIGHDLTSRLRPAARAAQAFEDRPLAHS